MAIKYLKKAIKTPSTDDHKTRSSVQNILDDIEKRREEGIKEITKKFLRFCHHVKRNFPILPRNLKLSEELILRN